MKDMAMEEIAFKGAEELEQDRLEIVLAESERILNRVSERLKRMDKRQEEMEIKYKQLDGLLYFMEWQLDKFEKENNLKEAK
ncbi:hypothetical protein MKX72_07320 [Priestia sp. FSL R5-0597]|uniref:hypothetical protein n=1 Tax=Priestia TaxID=2800373 RepID=UPI0012B89F31|nr:hypothetical protein [Priestia megaterium]